MLDIFPQNPSDGTIFEISNGLYYVYESTTQTWVRITGTGQIIPTATPISDGLMAASDLRKINRIMVPMPSSTIKGENCSNRFVSGHINLYSTDNYLEITAEPLIRNNGVSGNYPFRISQNTAGFDFTIDKATLINDLVARGNINIKGPTGKQGVKGIPGNPGGSLLTGPQGPQGLQGTSPTCTVSINADTAPTQINSTLNKAIVSLDTQQISDTEYAIIANRGVIGNPDIAPSTVNANCNDKSMWVLAIPTPNSGGQQVYYVDLSLIIEAIQDKFESEILRLKTGHENVVQFWLQQMSTLFYAQKASLCCAITNCAMANAATSTTSSPSTTTTAHVIVDPNTTKATSVAIGQSTKINQPIMRKLTIDGLKNVGTIKQAANIDLPAGHYIVEIIDCCIKTGEEYVGNIHVIYNNQGKQQVQFVRPGNFTNQRIAKRSYEGLTIEIYHSGGPIQSFMESSLLKQTSGYVTINFVSHNKQECEIKSSDLNTYKSAWLSGQYKGNIIRIANQDYIVIQLPPNTINCTSNNIAWPTFDNKTFIDIPGNSFLFKADNNLNNLVRQLTNMQETILFPTL